MHSCESMSELSKNGGRRWSARSIKSFAMGELEARKLKFPNTGTEALLMGILIEGLLSKFDFCVPLFVLHFVFHSGELFTHVVAVYIIHSLIFLPHICHSSKIKWNTKYETNDCENLNLMVNI